MKRVLLIDYAKNKGRSVSHIIEFCYFALPRNYSV